MLTFLDKLYGKARVSDSREIACKTSVDSTLLIQTHLSAVTRQLSSLLPHGLSVHSKGDLHRILGIPREGYILTICLSEAFPTS